MKDFKVSGMFENMELFWKIDMDSLKETVLSQGTITSALDEDTGFILIIRDDAYKFKQFNRWRYQGMTGYDIIVPYEKAVSDDTTKEALTQVCADLIVECLLFWMEKERQKIEKERRKAEKMRAKAA